MESSPAAITGEETTGLVFNTTEYAVECSATFHGTSSVTTTTTQDLTPTYSGCTAFFFFGAIVNMNGCFYRFHLVEGSSPSTATTESCARAAKKLSGKIPNALQPTHRRVASPISSSAIQERKRAGVLMANWQAAYEGCPAPGAYEDGTVDGSITFRVDAGTKQQGTWIG